MHYRIVIVGTREQLDICNEEYYKEHGDGYNPETIGGYDYLSPEFLVHKKDVFRVEGLHSYQTFDCRNAPEYSIVYDGSDWHLSWEEQQKRKKDFEDYFYSLPDDQVFLICDSHS